LFLFPSVAFRSRTSFFTLNLHISMTFHFSAPVCRMSETNEKFPSSIATAPIRTASMMTFASTCPGSLEGDMSPNFDDFDDFLSSTSNDDEMSSSIDVIISPRLLTAAAATCMYSVSILLHLRTAVLGSDDADPPPVRYGTQLKSELPAPTTASKPTGKEQTSLDSPADVAVSWRADGRDLQKPSLAVSMARLSVPQFRGEATADEDEYVVRASRSILNKLTVEKFESLFEQLANCGIKHPHHISILMREIFEKATMQHPFIPMYAELCVQLEKDPRIAAVVEETDKLCSFRRLLLNECQNVFEQVLELRGSEAEKDPEIAICQKQRALGNIKLIGQLLVHGMLSSNLFVECCEALLKNHSRCPEALDSLVPLMMVAGPKFDNRSWQYYSRLGKVLSDMQVLTKDKSVPPRLRFLMRDVLDAREAGWPQSRHKAKVPTKLEEVRRDAEELPEANKVGGVTGKIRTDSLDAATGNACTGKKKSVSFSFTDASLKAEVFVPKASGAAFDVVAFRRTLATIFSDLATDKNIPAAVQKVRLANVPVDLQAEQFVDILTRIVEERRGAVRRCELAFIAGLGAAESSAFDRKECLAGIGLFFHDVYDGLCHEVHRLPAIMKSEFMPTVLTVFPAADLNKVVPVAMRK